MSEQWPRRRIAIEINGTPQEYGTCQNDRGLKGRCVAYARRRFRVSWAVRVSGAAVAPRFRTARPHVSTTLFERYPWWPVRCRQVLVGPLKLPDVGFNDCGRCSEREGFLPLVEQANCSLEVVKNGVEARPRRLRADRFPRWVAAEPPQSSLRWKCFYDHRVEVGSSELKLKF